MTSPLTPLLRVGEGSKVILIVDYDTIRPWGEVFEVKNES